MVFWIGLDFFGFRIGSGFSFGLDKRDSVLGLDLVFRLDCLSLLAFVRQRRIDYTRIRPSLEM